MRSDASETSPSAPDARWVHPTLTALPADRWGPFLAHPDGSLMTVDDQGLRTSRDEGATWSPAVPVGPGVPPPDGQPLGHYLLRTEGGVLVLIFLNYADWQFRWDAATGEPQAGCRLEIRTVRSLDAGRTWADSQCVMDGYNANFLGFIQTSTGRLVATVEHLVSGPGRWVACSVYSDDEGGTWARSNLIDLGGHGHHDGALEPAVAELGDGRLLMLIRTNLGRFWQALSDDQGRTWRTILPTGLDASSAPGALLKLCSGRLLLVWNRAGPGDGGRPAGPASDRNDGQHTEAPASWYREELSLAISGDDAATWSAPRVIARQPGELCYPYLFERRPGEVWITAGFTWLGQWGGARLPPFRVAVTEEAICSIARAGDR